MKIKSVKILILVFLGIGIMALININIDWSFTFVKPFLVIVAQIIILFLIVGPLVTFIFRPTNIFELSLNSKIYHTLSNFDWDYLREQAIDSTDTIIIEALSMPEMIGILIFFISFINYIAILSVGALITSFHININNVLGLNIINSVIKVIEIPVFFFIEFLVFRNLSEERTLKKLASTGRKLSKINPKSAQAKLTMIPSKG